MAVIWKGTPNYSVGRRGYRPEAIVIHIMAGTLTGTDAWFANPASQVSAHYGIGKNGEMHQYVKEEDTAQHAGVVDKPSWTLIKPGINPNLYTVGLEHEGQPTDVWTQAMKAASAETIRAVAQRWQIPIDRNHIVGHYQIRASKPNCPAVDKRIIDELIALAAPVVLMYPLIRKQGDEDVYYVKDGRRYHIGNFVTFELGRDRLWSDAIQEVSAQQFSTIPKGGELVLAYE
ncbi:MAG: peptidoglycan recognition family protein [bacterium]|nr:peptidoglycan recognition family protein [bacterium]MDZ4296303.1 peptidoglycan recognition family protein [Patescibacteria group bacterium]